MKAAQLMWRRETKELLLIVTTYEHKHEKKENEILLRLPIERQKRTDAKWGGVPTWINHAEQPQVKRVIFLGTVPSPPSGHLHKRLQLHFPPWHSFVWAKQSRGINIISGTIAVHVQIALTWLQTIIYLLFIFTVFFFFFGEFYFSKVFSPKPGSQIFLH